MRYQLTKNSPEVFGDIALDGSKSISNRVLVIQALCPEPFMITNLSTSDDTQAMARLLKKGDGICDVGPAGTTFRFLTAYFAIQEGDQILTGSSRMKERPIGALVDALRLIGADIEYLEKEGFPPLRIGHSHSLGKNYEISIPAHISSQFITALLLIAPCLPSGLKIHLKGQLVSASYLEMTLSMMAAFGIRYQFDGQVIEVPAQSYQPVDYQVESDWSAASYHYALAALSSECDLTLRGLHPHSMQGDAITEKLFEKLGIHTIWNDNHLTIQKNGMPYKMLDHDFILCPDIAQTMAVVCGALGVVGSFTGLETLAIKETDRIAALKKELAKAGVTFSKAPEHFSSRSGKSFYLVEGRAFWTGIPSIHTYHDHRMAMAFAPLSLIAPLIVEDPAVVGKSYPDFWKHLVDLGWEIAVV